MTIEQKHSLKKTLYQLIFLMIPTVAFMCYFLWRLNNYYSILENQWLSQGIYFSVGCTLSILIFRYRFRLITISALVFLINYSIYLVLQNINIGEFDSFYSSVKFYIFIILFSLSWIIGYGFSRSKFVTIIWNIALLIIEIILISKTSDITVSSLLSGLIPVLVYSFYNIYTAELIRNLDEDEYKFGMFITKRISAFLFLLMILFIGVLSLFKGNFKAIEKEWGGSKNSEKNEKGKGESMTKKGKDGGVSNKDQSKLSGSLSKDNQLIFVAKLDNFFPNSQTPNPLYFTSHYYTKFDTITQTFEIDEEMPNNDLFKVDPSKIPLYFKKTDKGLIKKSLATKDRKVVTAEIYAVNLSSESYLAPSTAFYCQPISIPKEYKQQYKSAYIAKMWVSELNSAYFIYNPAGNNDLEMFQELRFKKLREVNKIIGPDKKFMDYYTFMPSNSDYNKISILADSITKNEAKPIDKIIAIRDYFLSKDEFDQPLYRYSDNPGIPGIPSASKLNYFLFENRKGYCAYYAGATLFMFRSLGIPSRLVTGYSVTDRSSKNPGWYWFYQDQAHAWVQVYFQEYGWIDFDTTVPDVNTQQAPQPDGTPPPEVPETYLVIDGEVEEVNVFKKTLTIKSNKIIFHDSEYVSNTKVVMLTDVSLATLSNDTADIKLASLSKGIHVTAISHAEVFKTLIANLKDSLNSLVLRFPKPIPIDEVKVIAKEEKTKEEKQNTTKEDDTFNWYTLLYSIVGGVLFSLLLLLFCPLLIWGIFHLRAKKKNSSMTIKCYNINLAVIFYLNQLGYPYENMGTKEYALKMDKLFKTQLNHFNDLNQKVKYSKLNLNEMDIKFINEFYPTIIKVIKEKHTFKIRFKRFLNLYNTLHYFSKPKTS